MKIIKIERLYKDKYASLRDYQVRNAIEKNISIKVELEGSEEFMILRPLQLKKGVASPTVFTSSYIPAEGEQPLEYKLMDFMWKPTIEELEKKKDNLISKLGEDWYDKIGGEFTRDYMNNLANFIGMRRTMTRVCPDTKDLFNVFKLTPFYNIKVVIIGQDPYHTIVNGECIAHGLAFSSKVPFEYPPSLKNIFQEVESDIKNGLDLLPDPNLTRWAKQGVLLLNTILSVDQGKADSHSNQGWEIFTEQVIRSLNTHPNRLVFLLWGKKAQVLKRVIDTGFHLVLEAAHPAAECYSMNAGFYGCKHFSKTNEFLKQNGYGEINW